VPGTVQMTASTQGRRAEVVAEAAITPSAGVKGARANRASRAVMGDGRSGGWSRDAQAVLAVVPEWWERRAVAAGVHTSAERDLGAPPMPCDSVTPRQDLLDATPEELANAYVVALDERVRSAEGRHYTPGYLANALYRQASEVLGLPPRGLVWDPACGAGTLLFRPLIEWLARNRDAAPEHVMATVGSAVGGCDTDSAAVWLGNALLASELLPVWSRVAEGRRAPFPRMLQTGDGLMVSPPLPPEVVILNPPYGRVRLTDGDRERWRHVVYGHANRYGLFLAASAALVVPGGVVSALVPAGWLGGSYFHRLREYLAQTAPLQSITYVTDRSGVFSTGVLQETVLATFRKGADPGATHCGRIFLNGTVIHRNLGSVRLPRSGSLPWMLLRDPADRCVLEAAERMHHRLNDYGWSVSTGPLVWNRVKPWLSAVPRRDSVKVVWAADFDGGSLHQDETRDSMRYVIFPEERARAMVLERPAVLVQRTTAVEQPRRIVAAILSEENLAAWGGRVVVENHVNVLTCSDPATVLTPRLLAAFLRSRALDRAFRCLSGSVAVSAYELAALPMPGPEVLLGLRDLPLAELEVSIEEIYGLAPERTARG
jgi:adenine-specific DNA-methyltransferase